MKRARDRWDQYLIIGVFAVLLALFSASEAVKATALFRTTTTTTTTEAPEVEDGVDPEGDTTPASNLTGIPQIDYVHDPNLPRELNGYNLSSYPFYATVPPPEEMDFKCEGLHDGFYASVPEKCQVYHQCLYGTRYDFLCANYTAFDQRTFICHFVSEVDCVNSPKYFSRNDALYKSDIEVADEKKAAKLLLELNTTITVAQNSVDFYERSTQNSVDSVQKNYKHPPRKGNDALYKATTTSTAAPPPTTTTTTTPAPPPPRSRPGYRRRPSRRRRPQYDYYDDEYYPSAADDEEYYEEDRVSGGGRHYNEGRSNVRRPTNERKRPRPSQRKPAYDEYEDDRYDRRQESRTRYDEDDRRSDRPSYDRPRKTQGRRPTEDREKADDRPKHSDEDRSFERNKKNRPNDERRTYEDEQRSYERPRRPYRDDDRPSREDTVKEEPKNKDDKGFREERPRRPYRDDDRPSREDSVKEEPKNKDDKVFREERPRRPYRDEDRPSREVINKEDKPLREKPYREVRPYRDSQKNERRPIKDDPIYDDDEPIYADEYKDKKSDIAEPPTEGLVKPSGSSLFSKPRVPPRIARPVPSKEKDKYKYVTSSSTKVPSTKAPLDEEYYDDYEDEPKLAPPPPKSILRTRSEPEKSRYSPPIETSKNNNDPPKRAQNNYSQRRPEGKESKRSPVIDDSSYEDFEDVRPKRPNTSKPRIDVEERQPARRRPAKVEEEYYYDDQESKAKDASGRGEMKFGSVPNKFKDEKIEEAHVQTEKSLHFPSVRPFFQKYRGAAETTTAEPSTTVADVVSKEETSDKNDPKQPYVRVVKRPFLPSRGGSPYLPRGLQPLGGKNFTKTTVAPTTSTTAATTTTTATTITTTSTQAPTTTKGPTSDYFYDSDYDGRDDKFTYKDSSSQEYVDKSQEKDYPIRPQTQTDERKSYFNYQKPSKTSKDFISTLPKIEKYNTESYSSQEKIKHNYEQNFRQDDFKAPDRLQTFKPSPQLSEPYKPTNRPFSPKIPENISIKSNLADTLDNEYDVTLNDALNPTISNLPPVRNFPSPFIVPADRDYTFSRFRNYSPDSSAAGTSNYNYQIRPPGKFDNNQRYNLGHGYVRKDHDAIASASLVNPSVVSVRTPQSFYIRPRYSSSGYIADETNSGLSHVTYRQVNLGDYA